MNRQIKFRAWDGLMWYEWKKVLNETDGTFEWRFFPIDWHIANAKVYAWDDDRIIGKVLFTGLTDKNGKEIYESDLVRWDDCSDGKRWRIAVVEISPDIQFKIVRIKTEMIQSAKEGHVFRFGNFAYQDTENHLEIIGNLYENKELLNQ